MIIELNTYLSGIAALTALIGTRLFNGFVPQGTDHPYVTYNRLANLLPHHMLGSSGASDRAYQFDIVSFSIITNDAIETELRNALDGFRGLMPPPAGTANIQRSFLRERSDDSLPPPHGDERSLYRTIMDFDICHSESIATP